MKTESSPATRTSPLVVNCFYFGGTGGGHCHHPVNANQRCAVAACAMLAADLRRGVLAASTVAEVGLTAFAPVR